MQLEIPAGPFKAYIFDCDGTVVDSMPLHYRAWKAPSPNGTAISLKTSSTPGAANRSATSLPTSIRSTH